MSTAARHPGIRKVTTKGGETRYRLIIDMGRKPDGSRDQRCETFTRLGDAKARQGKIIADRKAGTLVKPTKVTLAKAIDDWLAGRLNLRPAARRSPVVHRQPGPGPGPARSRPGPEPHQGPPGRSGDRAPRLWPAGRQRPADRPQPPEYQPHADPARGSAGLSGPGWPVARNVARQVERPKQTRREMQTWTADQAGRFLEAVADDRLAPAWQLSLYGLRRGEILGLCWKDIDLDARTLTIRLARTSVAGEVLEGEPKTERSKRTLPLDDGLVAALRSLKKTRQAGERLEAGQAYPRGCGGCGGAHVVVDELGQPYRPEWYSDRFARIAKAAGLPAIRLHDARHTSVTLMILRGVPIPVVSARHGHASAAFTMAFYAHSQDDALAAAGETLAAAYGRSDRAVKLR